LLEHIRTIRTILAIILTVLSMLDAVLAQWACNRGVAA
jgi:hypothetical protein